MDQKKKDFAKERNMQKIAKKCIYSKAMLVNCKDSLAFCCMNQMKEILSLLSEGAKDFY